MTPITISKTGTGRSSVVGPDSFQNPFNLGLIITVTGTATFNIELSMDDPMTSTPSTWIAATSFSGLTASAVGSITIPCHALSINVTSGTGTVVAQIVQAGVR
jgi:hypothetical protein